MCPYAVDLQHPLLLHSAMTATASLTVPPPLASLPDALEDIAFMARRFLEVCLGLASPHSAATPAPLRRIGIDSPYELVPMLALVVVVGLSNSFWEFVGSIVGRACGLTDKAERFKDSFAELVYYSSALFMVFRVTGGEAPWLFPSGWSEVMWDGKAQLATDVLPFTVPAEIKFYYLVELGWYTSALFKVLVSRKKKDFYEMLAHHIVTLLLLLLSLYAGNIRAGIVVLMLHNLFDPPLHLAKCTNYLKISIVCDTSFAICAVTFFVSRLYYYPQAIHAVLACNSTTKCGCGGGHPECASLMENFIDKTPAEKGLWCLLVCLLPIHILWFTMILKVLKKALMSSGVQGDVREDTDSEYDEPAKKKKAQ